VEILSHLKHQSAAMFYFKENLGQMYPNYVKELQNTFDAYFLFKHPHPPELFPAQYRVFCIKQEILKYLSKLEELEKIGIASKKEYYFRSIHTALEVIIAITEDPQPIEELLDDILSGKDIFHGKIKTKEQLLCLKYIYEQLEQYKETAD